MRNNILLLISFLCIYTIQIQAQSITTPPSPPDYDQLNHWASHPEKKDSADVVPCKSELQCQQENADVDVFFIHPTTMPLKSKNWNASLDNEKLNKTTDKLAIKHQASIFNGSCRIFAPRYRQAHYKTFRTLFFDAEHPDAKGALDLAYEDVKQAFEYYLENHNNDRPIVIAAHSQGSNHGRRLLKEYFDGTELQDLLVAAYLVGMPIRASMYEHIEPCNNADDIGCYNTWNTYRWGTKVTAYHEGAVVTNPVNWTTDDTYASTEESKGFVLRAFDKFLPNKLDAKCSDGILWVHKPKFPGSFLLMTDNYHIGDYNLFYMDVRENVANRVDQFMMALKEDTSNIEEEQTIENNNPETIAPTTEATLDSNNVDSDSNK